MRCDLTVFIRWYDITGRTSGSQMESDNRIKYRLVEVVVVCGVSTLRYLNISFLIEVDSGWYIF